MLRYRTPCPLRSIDRKTPRRRELSVPCGRFRAMPERPPVPAEIIRRLGSLLGGFPDCQEEEAWAGVRWRVGGATVAHVFGGEDQLFRITFRAEPSELMAFERLGAPYFRASWGENVVGLVLGDDTDWDELAELLTDSYCLQAPPRLADQVARPDQAG
ncbi:hypothetical protein FraEuI1c_2969 [Pseudofrankia inefficax]|uniref:MmcQ/YjbR family DNA-binding protein n=2 Tax=Pseudofrankia inefficax (strain DSM 45817 / CECT 9037 / DDB 130130 / EuI1c) TaxID=298654 RepID=E3JAE3_PSEI1|nr:hypothetical protein FraEuI1c_2969 [Pseudofrankia inefficax]